MKIKRTYWYIKATASIKQYYLELTEVVIKTNNNYKIRYNFNENNALKCGN